MTRDSDASNVLILIPAAGASSRMQGRDKLLEEVDGQPLLARQVARALATGAEVLVTLSKAHPARQETLNGLQQARLRIEMIDGREGMAVSLRTGARLAAERNRQALMVHLPDMPDLDRPDLLRLMAAQSARPDQLHRAASATGQPGHPVVIPKRLFEKLETVTGDSGARGVVQGEQVRLIPLPGDRAVTDLDTPEDWALWRSRQS